jgi:hypothetical protein
MFSRSVSAALILAGLAACQKAPEKAPENRSSEEAAPTASASTATDAKTVSAEPSSFEAVARHLDAGGGLYLYVSAEGVAKTCAEIIGRADGVLFSEEGGLPAAQRAQFAAAWKVLKPLLGRSGLKEITGFGMSSIAIAPEYYRGKTVLHHDAGQGNGFIWKLNGGQARALELIDYLPVQTAAAASFDLTFEPIWAELNRIAADSPELRAGLDQMAQKLLASSGLDIAKLLAGFGPNLSYVITLDESKPFALPSPTPVSVPEPCFALLIQIRDESLTARLENELAKQATVTAADQGDFKVRKIAPPVPLPFITPAIAWSKELLVVSSNEALLQEMLAVKAGTKPGLAKTAPFKQAMQGLPSPATSFSYVAPLFGKTVGELQMMSLNQANNSANPANPAIKQMMQAMMSLQAQAPAAAVGQNLPDGLVTVGNSGVGPRQVAAMGMWIPVGAIMGAAQPIAKTKDRSEAVGVLETLRLIEASSDQWALEKGKATGDRVTTDDIKVYLKPGTPLFLACEKNPGGTVVELIPGLPGVALPPVGGKLLVPAAIAEKFSAVCPPDFWGTYGLR